MYESDGRIRMFFLQMEERGSCISTRGEHNQEAALLNAFGT